MGLQDTASLGLPSSTPSLDFIPPKEFTNINALLHGLIQPFTMIIVSEIGDKTFLITAILAMRHPRLSVFLGAFSSLLLMSVLSAEMGHFLPNLVPKSLTQFLAALLFLVFGLKMWVEARSMKSDKVMEEMKEAEEEIEEDEAGAELQSGGRGRAIPLRSMEEGQATSTSLEQKDEDVVQARTHSPHTHTKAKTSWREGARNFCSLFFGPVFVQAFVLTFLGEWGDRSQIATIMLGAAHNVYIVAIGTIMGHSCCTLLAVMGGQYVSTKLSVKHITYGGSFLFILFSLMYFYQALSMDPDSVDISIPISADEH
ncbi:Uncharacterized protein family UPF0016 domain containing protein [Amanita muscaria]